MQIPLETSRASAAVVACALLVTAAGALGPAWKRAMVDCGRATPAVAIVLTPVDVNSATADELELLPGVGPSLAGRIVLDRQERGRFASPADLDRVKGIGPTTVAKLAPHITCGDASVR